MKPAFHVIQHESSNKASSLHTANFPTSETKRLQYHDAITRHAQLHQIWVPWMKRHTALLRHILNRSINWMQATKSLHHVSKLRNISSPNQLFYLQICVKTIATRIVTTSTIELQISRRNILKITTTFRWKVLLSFTRYLTQLLHFSDVMPQKWRKCVWIYKKVTGLTIEYSPLPDKGRKPLKY